MEQNETTDKSADQLRIKTSTVSYLSELKRQILLQKSPRDPI